MLGSAAVWLRWGLEVTGAKRDMDSRKQVTFLERESVCQDLQQLTKTNAGGRTIGFQVPKVRSSFGAQETYQKMSSKIVSPIPPPFDGCNSVQTATPEYGSQRADWNQEEEHKPMAISTSDICPIQRDHPKQQEFSTENAKKRGKKSNTLTEGEVDVGMGKGWKTQSDSDLPVRVVTLQTDGLLQMGEMKKNLQSRLDELQVNFQTGVNKLQNAFESGNSQVELSVAKVSSAVTSIETTLQSVDSNLGTINSNLLQLQETVEFGFKELTQEVASLVKWLCQNLSAGPAENQPILSIDNETS
ncbi:uncharacterized protein LOC129709416 [Leucoraja erinacea]|uniref:uncharacterized protein LOC129709416 n=1 Tax=Leucoraja erinaceus TaxID=7782 RepID=UPI0024575A17|nr:uncharacterized protein LOC129709416 [Leucoraja erinacea]